MALAALQALLAVLWYLLLGRVASAARLVLSHGRVRTWLDRVTAAAFFGFGLRLAFDAQG